MTVWSYRQLINRIGIRYEKTIYGIRISVFRDEKPVFVSKVKFFNEKG